MMFQYKHNWFLFLVAIIICAGCNKIVTVSEPINTITSAETFATDANARSAMAGIYGYMSVGNNGKIYSNGALTQICGLSADEFTYFDETNVTYMQFQTNTLKVADASDGVNAFFWAPAYFSIYQANAAIEGLMASKTISQNVKQQLLGEAKFIRAFAHFYLVNLFGDIPLMTTTAWESASKLRRTPVNEVYDQIITDLKDAQNLLSTDYSMSGGERIRANKFVATALLARVYLYIGKYADAIIQSDAIIKESSLYNLASDPNGVFVKDNAESILELQVLDNYPWATSDGFQFIPPDSNTSPNYILTSQLLADFEDSDLRRYEWIDSSDFTGSGTYSYFPFKYKIRQGDVGNVSEAYIVLRLAEQYLIRAESLLLDRNDFDGAISDLNVIRNRAGLPNYNGPKDKNALLSAILHERRIEFFAEFGHRWLDLKRLGLADEVLHMNKPQWASYQVLYPIPIIELQSNPNLQQNSGY